MDKFYIKKTLLGLLLFLIYSCSDFNSNSEYRVTDYLKFTDTPIADLAFSVDNGDTAKICEFLTTNNPNMIDYQEPFHKTSLLMMTIMNQRRASFPYSIICANPNCGLTIDKGQYDSFCCLLNHGASVKVMDVDGNTPLMIACSCDYYDESFVKHLINHGADVNYVLPEEHSDRMGNSTPLQNAVRCMKLDFVKILVENGANVNYTDKYGNTPLGMSLYDSQYITTLYLLEKGADYTIPITDVSIHTGNPQDTCRLTLIEELRYRIHPLGSEKHKQKMQIVQFLKKRGVDYEKVKIPEYTLSEIKKEYPESWGDFIKQY